MAGCVPLSRTNVRNRSADHLVSVARLEEAFHAVKPVRLREVGAIEISAREINAGDIGARQIRARKIGIFEDRPSKDCALQISKAQQGLCEVGVC